MNDLQEFDNEEFGRVRMVAQEDGQIFFCGVDVARALGYSNPRDAIQRHCKGPVVKRDVGVQTGIKVDGTPATQLVEMTFIPESDLYRLAFGSKLPAAEEFTDWVTREVLPSIRRYGQYVRGNTLLGDGLTGVLQAIQKTVDAIDKRLTALENRPAVELEDYVPAIQMENTPRRKYPNAMLIRVDERAYDAIRRISHDARLSMTQVATTIIIRGISGIDVTVDM